MNDDVDDIEPVEGTSFWEPSGYKRTTKRITDGNTLCNELVEMMQERCEIEAKFATNLKAWSKRWGEKIDKGPEFGTMESAWRTVLSAADREADVHIHVKDNLVNNVQNDVRRWQKDNFHKGMMSLHFKEKKDMDEEFRKAQKPWVKKLKIVEKYKNEYHGLCMKEQHALNREKNARNDAGMSEDQKAKIADEVMKLGSLKQSAKGSYEDALKDLNSYNPRYMEDMKEVYQKCQAMENSRLEFFRDRLLAAHRALDLSNDIAMKQIYADYLVGVEAANSRSDLKWWDIQKGIDMPMNWPQFEEVSQKITPITTTSRFGLKSNGENNTISGGTFRKKEETPSAVPPNRFSTISVTTTTVTNGTISSTKPLPSASSRDSINRHSNSSFDANPFSEEWSESPEGSLEDHSKPGVKVRALYSYGGEESDELSFREGDVFDKIEERDEQGWAKGRKDGKVGLFPADYVSPI